MYPPRQRSMRPQDSKSILLLLLFSLLPRESYFLLRSQNFLFLFFISNDPSHLPLSFQFYKDKNLIFQKLTLKSGKISFITRRCVDFNDSKKISRVSRYKRSMGLKRNPTISSASLRDRSRHVRANIGVAQLFPLSAHWRFAGRWTQSTYPQF